MERLIIKLACVSMRKYGSPLQTKNNKHWGSLLWIGFESDGSSPPSRQTAHQNILLDVTNISTDRFRVQGSNGDATNAFFEGNTNYNATTLLFKRIGDT